MFADSLILLHNFFTSSRLPPSFEGNTYISVLSKDCKTDTASAASIIV